MRIVMLHGWLMSPEIWTASRRSFPDSWEVIAPSQPGHGTEPALSENSMGRWRDWLVSKTGEDRPMLLVGHSMGGMLALSMLRHRPELVAGVVVVASTATAWSAEQQAGWQAMLGAASPGWAPEMAQALAGVLYGPRYLHAHPQTIARWHELWLQQDLRAATSLGSVIGERENLTSIPISSTPAAVLRGAEDPAISADEAAATASWLGTTVTTVPAAGHCLPLEAPQAVFAAIEGVIAGILARGNATGHAGG